MLTYKKIYIIIAYSMIHVAAYAQGHEASTYDESKVEKQKLFVEAQLNTLRQKLLHESRASIFDSLPNLWYVPELFSVQHQYTRYGHQDVSDQVSSFVTKTFADHAYHNLIIKKMNDACRHYSIGMYCSHNCVFVDEELLLVLGLESPEVDFIVKHSLEWHKNKNHLKMMILRISTAGLRSYIIGKLSYYLFEKSLNYVWPYPAPQVPESSIAYVLYCMNHKVAQPVGKFMGKSIYFEAVDKAYNATSNNILGTSIGDYIIHRYMQFLHKKVDITVAHSAQQACSVLESICMSALNNNISIDFSHVNDRITSLKI